MKSNLFALVQATYLPSDQLLIETAKSWFYGKKIYIPQSLCGFVYDYEFKTRSNETLCSNDDFHSFSLISTEINICFIVLLKLLNFIVSILHTYV